MSSPICRVGFDWRDMRGTIAVDFDGVLHDYLQVQWVAMHVISGPPIPGAIEWLRDIASHFDVVIFTCRGRTWRGRRAVRRWLEQNGFNARATSITDRKPIASLYIDDRAWKFSGSFPDWRLIKVYNP